MGSLGIEENWWLYVVLFAALFILLAVNSYIIVIWQHPDDKNEAYFPKAVVVSTHIVWFCVARPLRAASVQALSRIGCGGIRISTRPKHTSR